MKTNRAAVADVALAQNSQSVARDKNKEYNQANPNQHGEEQDHHGPCVEQPPDIGFSYSGPVHECIFAKPNKSKDWVDGILLRRKSIHSNSEGKDQLPDS